MHLSSTKNESEVPGSGLTIRNIYREDTINQPSFQVFTINNIYYYFKAYFKIELAFTLSMEQASRQGSEIEAGAKRGIQPEKAFEQRSSVNAIALSTQHISPSHRTNVLFIGPAAFIIAVIGGYLLFSLLR
ncbi:hypothetical protein [Thermosporothrix hazakensis]|jgi:hypothetical protein|uniref:hypothetical protein n=1 Tax=Thermosporothrix hazakensis TaxID=644383 RepID=UPI000DACB34C|nr:hypothetical protein [Thermosporothrix hazakensis]